MKSETGAGLTGMLLGPAGALDETAAVATTHPEAVPAGPPAVLPVVLGGYRVERLLGQGGMGSVYQAHDDRLGRAVAVKTMRPEVAAQPAARERFLREAQAAAGVVHDNVIPVWQVGEEAGVPFIAMPLLHGESLADRLGREPVSPVGVVLQVGREVAAGLAAAHARGLVHRDIKPGNVWLEGDPTSADPAEQLTRCKILDFGLARPAAADTPLTASGAVVGTPAYMSPEQAAGGAVDARTDLFSLGVVLYRMATGEAPFAGPTVMAVLTSLAVTTPPPAARQNPAVPAPLSELIAKLLAKDPAARPASARAVADALGEIARPHAAGRKAPPRKSWKWVAARLFGVAAVVMAGVVIKVTDRDGKVATVEVPDGSRVKVDPAGQIEVAVPRAAAPEPAPARTAVVPTATVNAAVAVPAPMNAPLAVPPAAPANPDAQRRVAEWAIGCGGKVTVERPNVADTMAAAPADLPAEPFTVTAVNLMGCDKVADADLSQLASLTRMRLLCLSRTRVTDAGMTHLAPLTRLTGLDLSCTRVTDAGLVHLRELSKLTELSLQETRVTDAGLLQLREHKEITTLNLRGLSGVTGAGLESLKGMAKLQLLDLLQTQVSDAGLQHLQAMTAMTWLNLEATKVTGAGLSYLAGINRLNMLVLTSTRVSDAGLAHLKRLTNLQTLMLEETQVTDAGMDHLSGLAKLQMLYLSGTEVTNAGLHKLEGLSKLTQLGLRNTRVTPSGIEKLRQVVPKCSVITN